jgi:hypothetical protein
LQALKIPDEDPRFRVALNQSVNQTDLAQKFPCGKPSKSEKIDPECLVHHHAQQPMP